MHSKLTAGGKQEGAHLPRCLQLSEAKVVDLPRTIDALAALEAEKLEKLQHRLTEVANNLNLALVYLSAPSQAEKAKLVSMMQTGAGAYLNAIPTEPGLTVPGPVFTWTVSRRLGCATTATEDTQEAELCTCRSGARSGNRSKEQHVFNCKCGGGNQRRHDRLRDTIADMFRSLGYQVRAEPRAFHQVFGQGGPDLEVLSYPTAGVDTFVEVSVINPATVKGAERQPWLAAKTRELAKRQKYGSSVQALERKVLRTAVIESTGALGRDLSSIIKELDKRWVEQGLQLPETTTWTSSFSEYWRQRISVSLIKGAGEMRAMSQNAPQDQRDGADRAVGGQHHARGSGRPSQTQGRRDQQRHAGNDNRAREADRDGRQSASKRVTHSSVTTARTAAAGPTASAPRQELPRQPAVQRVSNEAVHTSRTAKAAKSVSSGSHDSRPPVARGTTAAPQQQPDKQTAQRPRPDMAQQQRQSGPQRQHRHQQQQQQQQQQPDKQATEQRPRADVVQQQQQSGQKGSQISSKQQLSSEGRQLQNQPRQRRRQSLTHQRQQHHSARDQQHPSAQQADTQQQQQQTNLPAQQSEETRVALRNNAAVVAETSASHRVTRSSSRGGGVSTQQQPQELSSTTAMPGQPEAPPQSQGLGNDGGGQVAMST